VVGKVGGPLDVDALRLQCLCEVLRSQHRPLVARRVARLLEARRGLLLAACMRLPRIVRSLCHKLLRRQRHQPHPAHPVRDNAPVPLQQRRRSCQVRQAQWGAQADVCALSAAELQEVLRHFVGHLPGTALLQGVVAWCADIASHQCTPLAHTAPGRPETLAGPGAFMLAQSQVVFQAPQE